MTIYSYSRLKCYEQCPQKYKFQYIDRVKIEVRENIELFLGRRIHKTLKKLYQDLMYQKENTLGDLLGFLREEWATNWNDSIRIVKEGYSPGYYLGSAEQYITDYYQRYKPFNQNRTIAVEKQIFVNLDGLRGYTLCSCIDRVTKTRDGCYHVHDYKTCSRLPSKSYFQNDWQLLLYVIALKKRYPYIKNVYLVWHLLKFDQEINSRKSDKELEELKRNTIQTIDSIENAGEFPTNPSRLCDWCKFKPICR